MVLLVANPTSGRGRALRWAERAHARLTELGIASHLAVAQDEAASLLAQSPERFSESWVFGGDGTLADLTQSLPRTTPPPIVALFPVGTGNVVARSAEVPLGFEGAWRVARASSLRPFDLLRIEAGGVSRKDPARRAAFMVSAGLDAELARFVAAHRTGTMRRLGWVSAGLRSGAFAREAPLRARADGRDLGVVHYAAAFNCGLYAGGFRVCPQARFDDGRIHLLLLREPIRPRWKSVVWAALRGRLDSLSDATLVAATEIELDGVECSQVDGDPGPSGRLQIGIEPAALRLRAPVSSGR